MLKLNYWELFHEVVRQAGLKNLAHIFVDIFIFYDKLKSPKHNQKEKRVPISSLFYFYGQHLKLLILFFGVFFSFPIYTLEPNISI